MKKKPSKPILKNRPACNVIVTGDWHLREDTPPCRTDNFLDTQKRKLQFIHELVSEHDAEIIHTGDLFHKPKPSPFMLSWAIENIPRDMLVIPGNHDLPGNNMANYEHSGLRTLEASGVITTIDQPGSHDFFGIPFYIVHAYIDDEHQHWMEDSCLAENFMKTLPPHIPYVLTGDNHKSFTWSAGDDEPILINPGSLTRQTIDSIDHRPCVYLITTEGVVFTHYVDIEDADDVFGSEYIKKEKERNNENIQKFIEQLGEQAELGLSFEENLKKFIMKNKIEERVQQYIQTALGE